MKINLHVLNAADGEFICDIQKTGDELALEPVTPESIFTAYGETYWIVAVYYFGEGEWIDDEWNAEVTIEVNPL